MFPAFKNGSTSYIPTISAARLSAACPSGKPVVLSDIVRIYEISLAGFGVRAQATARFARTSPPKVCPLRRRLLFLKSKHFLGTFEEVRAYFTDIVNQEKVQMIFLAIIL